MSVNPFNKYIEAYDEGEFTREMLLYLVEKCRKNWEIKWKSKRFDDNPYDASQVRARGTSDNPFGGGSFPNDSEGDTQ
jgi:hypothetical protein